MAEAWAPTVEEIGARLRARTKVRSGEELGTFTEPDDPLGETRPTKKQVESMIESAVSEVLVNATPCKDRPNLEARAKGLAILYTCMEIEISYYPEQVAADKSPYARFKELWDEGIPKYVEAVQETCGGEEDDESGSGSVGTRGFFGNHEPIGMDTVM